MPTIFLGICDNILLNINELRQMLSFGALSKLFFHSSKYAEISALYYVCPQRKSSKKKFCIPIKNVVRIYWKKPWKIFLFRTFFWYHNTIMIIELKFIGIFSLDCFEELRGNEWLHHLLLVHPLRLLFCKKRKSVVFWPKAIELYLLSKLTIYLQCRGTCNERTIIHYKFC